MNIFVKKDIQVYLQSWRTRYRTKRPSAGEMEFEFLCPAMDNETEMRNFEIVVSDKTFEIEQCRYVDVL